MRSPPAPQRDLPYEVAAPALRTLGQTVGVPSEAPFLGAHYRVTQVGGGMLLFVGKRPN